MLNVICTDCGIALRVPAVTTKATFMCLPCGTRAERREAREQRRAARRRRRAR